MVHILRNIIDIELRFVSGISDKNYLIFPAVLLGIFILYRYNKKIEAFLLTLTLGSFVYSALLKAIFQETRPLTAQQYFLVERYSFPSTHTVTYTTIFGYILYLTYKLNKRRKENFINTFVRFLCIFFIALVGISRVYLGQHFIQDIVAGYGFGSLYLAGILYFEKFIEKKQKV